MDNIVLHRFFFAYVDIFCFLFFFSSRSSDVFFLLSFSSFEQFLHCYTVYLPFFFRMYVRFVLQTKCTIMLKTSRKKKFRCQMPLIHWRKIYLLKKKVRFFFCNLKSLWYLHFVCVCVYCIHFIRH